jgi:hypothetical protein
MHDALRAAGHLAVHVELVSPGNCPYRPAGQTVHSVAAVSSPNLPGGHF